MSENETKRKQNIFQLFIQMILWNKKNKEFLDNGYLMDPHTATCIKAYNET